MNKRNYNYQKIALELAEIVGSNNVLSQAIDLAVYGCDAETLDSAIPDLVVLPGNTQEVQAVVKIANKHSLPYTARGAGTGLSGGATTVCGGISLVLTRMTKIIEIDPQQQIAVVESGVTNSSVSQAVAKYRLCFAPDPSSQLASTIGGNIAENAGGPHTLKYGTTVDHVLAMTVVLPDGNIAKFGSLAQRDFGFDWTSLFTGSEGTLGIVTEATLRLIPLSEFTQTAIVYFPTLESGGGAVTKIIASGVIPCAMEMMDQLTLNAVEDAFQLGLNRTAAALLIVEIDGNKESVENERTQIEQILKEQGVSDYSWAQSDKERAQMWKARKAAFGALGRIAPHAYVLDGVVPRSQLAAAIRSIEEIGKKYALTIANIFHAGDGNLHPALLYDQNDLEETEKVLKASYEILKLCVNLGGVLSGEHGIGIEKAQAMPYLFGDSDMNIMECVKNAFDPKLLCNPGKILPTPNICGESGMRPLARHKLSLGC